MIPTNTVWDGISNPHPFQATGTDLKVVLRITPGAKTVVIRVGKDRRVAEVRGIYI